jgi:hypothetical protein
MPALQLFHLRSSLPECSIIILAGKSNHRSLGVVQKREMENRGQISIFEICARCGLDRAQLGRRTSLPDYGFAFLTAPFFALLAPLPMSALAAR